MLTLSETVTTPSRIEDCTIDWQRTQAWGSGGYYGRIFLNVEGREPQGTIPAAEYEAFRDKLIEKIETMRDPEGRPLSNKAYKPQDLYATVRGIPPDLIVYFGNLNWRSVGMVGMDGIYTFENDTGPDDANHDFSGIFIMDDHSGWAGRELTDLDLTMCAHGARPFRDRAAQRHARQDHSPGADAMRKGICVCLKGANVSDTADVLAARLPSWAGTRNLSTIQP